MSLQDTGLLEGLQEAIGHRFRDPVLLTRALTHSSRMHESGGAEPDNETFEFFGDAILSMLVTERLLEAFPERKEGELSKLRARLVRANTLARRARSLDLGRHLQLGRGEDRGGGRNKTSVLADAFEAVVAAVYLDGGLEDARRFVRGQLEETILQAAEATEPADFKSTLQVLSQKSYGCIPVYRVLTVEGPDHEKRFCVEVQLDGHLRSEGCGRSKKQAEQEAARSCWIQLRELARQASG